LNAAEIERVAQALTDTGLLQTQGVGTIYALATAAVQALRSGTAHLTHEYVGETLIIRWVYE